MKTLLSLSKYKLRIICPFGLTQKNEKLKAYENHTRKYYTDVYWWKERFETFKLKDSKTETAFHQKVNMQLDLRFVFKGHSYSGLIVGFSSTLSVVEGNCEMLSSAEFTYLSAKSFRRKRAYELNGESLGCSWANTRSIFWLQDCKYVVGVFGEHLLFKSWDPETSSGWRF